MRIIIVIYISVKIRIRIKRVKLDSSMAILQLVSIYLGIFI
jgi:hypothetical protein